MVLKAVKRKVSDETAAIIGCVALALLALASFGVVVFIIAAAARWVIGG